MTYKLTLNPGYVTNEGEIIGSFLVNSDGLILEYARIETEYGAINTSLVSSKALGNGSTEQLRDFIVAPDGTLHTYNGTFNPTLQSYNWQSPYIKDNTQTFSGWSTVNNGSYGGIDYYQNYVFVTDMKTYGSNEDEAQGIIRFSQTEEPAIRFAQSGNFIDLTVGLDNLIYGLESYGKISVYDPETLDLVRSFTLQDKYNNYRGIAINAAGEIFSAAWDGNIYYFNPEGLIVDVNQANRSGVVDFNTNNFNDINISSDGKELIASDRNGLVALLNIKNQYLELQDVFPTGGNSAFVSFGTSSNISTDSNAVPEISISDAEVLEWGEFEPARLDFTVSLSQASNETIEVDVYSFIPWELENPAVYSDVAMMNQMLTFAPGETEKIFSLDVFDDWEQENNEQVYVEASVISGNAIISDGLGVGTIIDDDSSETHNPVPTISISDAEALEWGEFEPARLDFTVSLSQASNETVEVDVYSFIPWELENPAVYSDVAMMNQMLTFAPGETEKIFSLDVFDDGEQENDEQVYVEASVVSGNAIVSDGLGIGTIIDDDFMPTVSISDAEMVEGDYRDYYNAPPVMEFTVSLDAPAYHPVSIDLSTIDYPLTTISNPAIAYEDFYPIYDWTNLTFEPGETEKTLAIEIFPDEEYEPEEQFAVEIISAYGAEVGDGLGVGTIIDDDLKPVVSISDTEVLEGDESQSSWMNFTVSLSEAFNEIVEVDVVGFIPWEPISENTPNSFANYDDVVLTSEILTFTPGETKKIFSIEVLGDLELESDEQIYADLDYVFSDNATIGDGSAIGTILDNEARKPQVSISDAVAVEGEVLEFTVELDRAVGDYVTVDAWVNPYDNHDEYTTALATEGKDYWGNWQSLTFAPGETSKIFKVETNYDWDVEGDEQFAVEIFAEPEAIVNDYVGIGTIADNDLVIGEVGHVKGINHFEQQIEFQNQYQNPVVFVSPLTRKGGDSAIARITDIQADGFSVFVQEPTLIRQKTHSGSHVLEDFSYMVMEAGSWTMADGTVMEVGLTEVDAYTRSTNWDRLVLEHDFNNPTVISSIQTYNNPEFTRLRQRNGNEDALDLALEKEEALLKTDYASETVGYMAVEAGQNYLPNEEISYLAGETGRTIDHRWQQLDMDDRPYLFASTNSYYGGDSVGLRYQMGSIMLDEDTSNDNEIRHTTEDIAYLGFDRLGTITTEIWSPEFI